MMKRIYTTLAILLITLSVTAQNRPVRGEGYMGANPARMQPRMVANPTHYNRLNLSAEQLEVVGKIQTNLRAEELQLRNQLAEKRAQLTILEQAKKPSTKSINSKVDEITALHNKMMKLRVKARMEIRKELTDEQKVLFDSGGARGRGGRAAGMGRR